MQTNLGKQKRRFISHTSKGEFSANFLNAKVEETQVSADLVTSTFVGSDDGRKIIAEIQDWAAQNYPEYDLRIVGSIIAAQAYPGQVVGMTPAPGYERVAPAEKRMSLEKFTVFTK